MTLKERSKRTKIIPEAILAVLTPIVGYYIAYNYEKGYARFFKIPSSFVEVSLIEVLKITGILFILFLILLGYLGIREDLVSSKNPIARAFGRVLLPVSLIVAFIYYEDVKGTLLIFPLIFLILMIFAEFILPLIRGRKIKGYKKKLEYIEETDKGEKTIFSDILQGGKNYSIITYTVIIILYFSLFGIGVLGESEARHKTSFVVIKSNPELVVLRKYSQRFICAEFNRKKKEVRKAFYLKSFDQIADEGFEIVTENIGPLRLSKVK